MIVDDVGQRIDIRPSPAVRKISGFGSRKSSGRIGLRIVIRVAIVWALGYRAAPVRKDSLIRAREAPWLRRLGSGWKDRNA